LGSESRPLRVAIIGSGPSGFYAADALLKSEINVHIAMFEKLPVPYGLVRFGVAPDHSKIRNVIKIYEKVAAENRFSYWGNITIGTDVSVEELQQHFDTLIFAFGAATDRRLGIHGEDLPRSYTATSFCAWYNGHPDFQDCQFDLSHETAVVIGQGNVAMDVARILALPAEELAKTDMASNAVQDLANSSVKDIYVIGRRGAVQAKFTPKEISELGEIPGCDLILDPQDLELSEQDQAELELPDSKQNQRNYELMKEMAGREPTPGNRRIFLKFYLSPMEILGENGVEGVVLQKNRMKGEPGQQWAEGTGETFEMSCGVFFRSVGYRGVALEGVPFDQKKSVIPNHNGRVDGAKQMYCTGWIKRGASGLIGTNKADSNETVGQLLEDLSTLQPCSQPSDEHLDQLLADRGVRVVHFADWKKIDDAEIARGEAKGKPRDNFTTVEDMLAALD
jgi:NADPH-dependent glutamate synthase beta subunit-like oxidoreductase